MSTPSFSAGHRPVCPPSAHPEAAALTVAIQRVGHLGVGLGTTDDGGPICVPFTLPGEQVRAQPIGRHASVELARAEAWISSSPDRVTPPCPHFGACGGCALQHWAGLAYLAWKTELLFGALRGAGYVEPNILPIVPTPARARRRIDLAFKRTNGALSLGLHRSAGQEVIDIKACEVLHPRLQELIAPLRLLLSQVPTAGNSGSVVLNLLDTGPDILVRAEGLPDTPARTLMTDFARSRAIARVHWARRNEAPEAICILDRATIDFADVAVTPPPGGFLQATAAGEAAIVAAVTAARSARRSNAKLVELYAGCGTLTFPLAQLGHVTAYEGNLAALAALKAAAHRAMPGRINCHHRDLVRQPLSTRELNGFAAAVLNPPWSGASVQIATMAKSTLSRVIYISCNPAALRRDADILRRAGFSLEAATPIDQFLWSPQLEAVAIFTR